MVEEKEPKGITRRQFLKGITALGASALLSSCGVKEEPVSQKPTETLRPAETTPPTKVPTQESSPTPQSTLTPESTPTPEITRIVGLTITADYLKNAFAGIGGEEVITNGQEEVSVVQFGQDYVSQSWGEEIDFTTLSQSPTASLKYLVSLGAYQGKEGVFTPGKQGEEIIFPQLKDLSLPRLTLEKIPSEGEQKEQEYPERVSPQGLLLRPQTQMTVIGLLNEPRPGAEVTVDKDAPGGEPNYVLVAFTDYLRASEEGILRHYLAILPTHSPADPENKNTLSLQNLLEANGYQYDSQGKEIAVVDQNNQKTILGLNRIEGEELTKDLRQATGLAFVDQMKGELIKNPVVPYYEEMPAIWEIKEETNEDGTISLLLQGQEELGDDFKEIAQARYDEGKEEWIWKEVEIALKPFGKIAVPNVFDLPGWVRPGVVITKDGFLVADSIEGAFGTFVYNETKGLVVEGDFEVQWKMVTTVKGDPKTRGSGQVCFNNRPPREATAYLEVGINEDNTLFFDFLDKKARKGKDLLDGASINAPDTGDLRVRFVGVNTGFPEKVLILNGESGEKIAEAELPLPLFSTGELFFSLWVVNTKEDPRGVQINISPMKILVPAESQNIKLR